MMDTFPRLLTRKRNFYCLRLPTGTGCDRMNVVWEGISNENSVLGLEDVFNIKMMGLKSYNIDSHKQNTRLRFRNLAFYSSVY